MLDAIHQTVNHDFAGGAEGQSAGLSQQLFEFHVGTGADQLYIETQRQIKNFATDEAEHLEITGNAYQRSCLSGRAIKRDRSISSSACSRGAYVIRSAFRELAFARAQVKNQHLCFGGMRKADLLAIFDFYAITFANGGAVDV